MPGSNSDRGREPLELLSVRHLAVEMRGARVIDDVSVCVSRGQVMGLVGESGSGKTLTARSVMGLLPSGARIVAGAVSFDGKNLLNANGEELRQLRGNRLSMIFQDAMSALNPMLPVGRQIVDVIRTHEDVSASGAARRAIEGLGEVRLPNPAQVFRSYPFELSGGMAQRVMIAMALACSPTVLIADEPTTALDATIQAQILQLLRDVVANRDVSILLITHNMGIVGEICDDVTTLYCGQTVSVESTEQLVRTPRHPYTRALVRSASRRLRVYDGSSASMRGLPASPYSPPSGCRFHPRCDARQDLCQRESPELVPGVAGGLTRCLRDRELAVAAIDS
jgi:peptide/nickel transport system ATP-binding protein